MPRAYDLHMTSASTSAVVIYESLTGNTKTAGEMIAAELTAAGVPAVACSTKQVALQQLSEANLVIVGSWTDGLFLFGQKPGGIGRLSKLPVIDGKKAAVYCTYALETGKTLEKLAGVVGRRGGDVIGGAAIRRDRMEEGVTDFVDRLLGAIDNGALESNAPAAELRS